MLFARVGRPERAQRRPRHRASHHAPTGSGSARATAAACRTGARGGRRVFGRRARGREGCSGHVGQRERLLVGERAQTATAGEDRGSLPGERSCGHSHSLPIASNRCCRCRNASFSAAPTWTATISRRSSVPWTAPRNSVVSKRAAKRPSTPAWWWRASAPVRTSARTSRPFSQATSGET
jgi:hypothetical protein